MRLSPHGIGKVRILIGGALVFVGAAVIGYVGLREVAVGRLGTVQPAKRVSEHSSDTDGWEWLVGVGGLAGGIAVIRGRRRS